jgi:hypothetical protein
MPLLAMAALQLPVFWSSRKLTSLQGTGASALHSSFHHLSLTICFAAVASLLYNTPSYGNEPTWRNTCAASAHQNKSLARFLRLLLLLLLLLLLPPLLLLPLLLLLLFPHHGTAADRSTDVELYLRSIGAPE